MNFATLTQFSATDPLPLTLGARRPRAEEIPPPPKQARIVRSALTHTIRELPDGKLVMEPMCVPPMLPLDRLAELAKSLVSSAVGHTSSSVSMFRELPHSTSLDYRELWFRDVAAQEGAKIFSKKHPSKVALPGLTYPREAVEAGEIVAPPGHAFQRTVDGIARNEVLCVRIINGKPARPSTREWLKDL